MSLAGMGPSLALEGPSTREVFEAYVQEVLSPTLEAAGRVVVMDNLAAHKGATVRELTEQRGAASLSTCRRIRPTSTP